MQISKNYKESVGALRSLALKELHNKKSINDEIFYVLALYNGKQKVRAALRIIDNYRINQFVPEQGSRSIYFYQVEEDSLFKKKVLLMGDNYCSCPQYFKIKSTNDGWLTCEHRLAVQIGEGLGVVKKIVEPQVTFQKRVNSFFGNIGKRHSESGL